MSSSHPFSSDWNTRSEKETGAVSLYKTFAMKNCLTKKSKFRSIRFIHVIFDRHQNVGYNLNSLFIVHFSTISHLGIYLGIYLGICF